MAYFSHEVTSDLWQMVKELIISNGLLPKPTWFVFETLLLMQRICHILSLWSTWTKLDTNHKQYCPIYHLISTANWMINQKSNCNKCTFSWDLRFIMRPTLMLLVSHSVVISRFFYHSDFSWNQFCGFSKCKFGLLTHLFMIFCICWNLPN